MNKEDKVIEPKLRFPEFKNSEKWVLETMKEITEKVGKKNTEGKTLPVYSINNQTGFLPQSEQFDGVDSNSRGYDTSLYKVIGKNTFAYNPARINVGSIGYSGELENILISSLYVCFKTKKQINDEFLNFFIGTATFNEFVNRNVEGGIRNYLFYENFSKIPFAFPSTSEQQKIADCLSSLDELIQAETERLEALQAHKKGLMQQLFPAEGETVPKLRFPEFQDSGEWVERELKKHLVAKPDYGINAPAVPYSKNLPTYLRITDISDEGNYKTEKKVSVAKPVSKSNYLTKGDIVITRTGASVGKSYLYSEEDGKLVFAGFLIRVKPDSSKLLPNFLSQFLTTDRYWEWVVFNSTRSGQPGLNGKQIESIQIPMPPSIEEQKKISEFLSSINDEIFTQNEKIETLKSHKKGLLQQLFPQLD